KVIKEHNGLVVINHPWSTLYPWYNWPLPAGYSAIEVWLTAWWLDSLDSILEKYIPNNRKAIDFWDQLLKMGHKIPAVGGIDNFLWTAWNLTEPTLHVYTTKPADKNSILQGVRKGRVFLTNKPDVQLRLLADVDENGEYNENDAIIGDTVYVKSEKEDLKLNFKILVLNAPGDADVFVITKTGETKIGAAGTPLTYTLGVDPTGFNYVWVEVKNGNGSMIGLTNPIYIEPKTRKYSVGTPGGIAVDDYGNLYVSSNNKGTIAIFPKNDKPLTFISGLNQPGDIEITPDGRALIIAEANGKVSRHFFGISGHVKDPHGTPLSGATVFVKTRLGLSKGYSTDAEGVYTVPDLLRPELWDDYAEITVEYQGKRQTFITYLGQPGIYGRRAFGQTIRDITFSPPY
ncbi:MAG: CehA/McbA family metallohydrolase, partial [Nitrospirota bacterium]